METKNTKRLPFLSNKVKEYMENYLKGLGLLT